MYTTLLESLGSDGDEVATPRAHSTTVGDDANDGDDSNGSSSEDEYTVDAARAMWNALKE